MFHTIVLTLVLANPQSLLQQATEEIELGQWEAAAESLDVYVEEYSNPSPEVLYDRGVAHYNVGNFGTAVESFDNAMNQTEDSLLKTYCAYNLGNAIYQETMGELEGTSTGAPSGGAMVAIDKAKTQIQEVLQQYRTTIQHDASDMDARANGELAWKMLQQLEQMQEEIEQQQEQQQQNDQQEQQQDDSSADQQQEQSQSQEQNDQEEDNQSEQEQSEQEQDQDGEQSEQQQSEQQEQNQEQDGEQTEQQAEQQEQNQQQDGEQSEQEQSGQQEQSQQQDGEQSEQKQSEQQEQSQQRDSEQSEQQLEEGELESTDEAMNTSKSQSANQKEEGERLTEQEANRLLQLIRDKEQQRRKALAARRAANRIPVGKDW